MHTVDYHLTIVNFTVALFKAELTLPYRLDLGAKKFNAGLDFFVDEELVVCAFVLSENFYSFCF